MQDRHGTTGVSGDGRVSFQTNWYMNTSLRCSAERAIASGVCCSSAVLALADDQMRQPRRPSLAHCFAVPSGLQ